MTATQSEDRRDAAWPRILNLTHAPQRLLDEDGTVIHEWKQQDGRPARVQWDIEITTVGGLPVAVKRFVRVHGLPAWQEGVAYLVTREVAQAMQGEREDLYFIEAWRNREGGRGVLGGRSLTQV